MKKLRCIIADDEPIARQIIENYLEELPNVELLASCKNAFEVMDFLQENKVDLLFLDINMPKLSGLSLLKTMRNKPEVIITTAYSEYALEGFELAVTDYLLKPFSLERFLQAILKVDKRRSTSPETTVASTKATENYVFVKSDKKIIKIDLDKVSHVEAYGNYIKIFTESMVLTPQTMTEFLEKLPSSFIRIHKSYVVNFNELKLIDGNQMLLKNGAKLPIGKSYRKVVLEKIESS